MAKIKWRITRDKPFEFWTNVQESNIKRYIGPIYPYESKNIKFRIVNPIPANLQKILSGNQEIVLLNMSEHFYLIEDNIILVYNPDFPVALLEQKNITHFKIGNNKWEPISNAHFFYQFCIVSINPKAFSVIGGQYPFVSFTDDSDIKEGNLIEKPFTELLQYIKIHNYLLM